MARARSSNSTNNKGENQDIKAVLWAAADKLRNNMDAAEYKHVVLGLIFLKYISDAFEEKMKRLTAKLGQQFGESSRLQKEIRTNLKGLGYQL